MEEKVIIGSINKVMATFYNDLAVSSSTKKGRDFCKKFAKYFHKEAEGNQTKCLVKGTIKKIN